MGLSVNYKTLVAVDMLPSEDDATSQTDSGNTGTLSPSDAERG